MFRVCVAYIHTVVKGCCWVDECGVGTKIVGGHLVLDAVIVDSSHMATVLGTGIVSNV